MEWERGHQGGTGLRVVTAFAAIYLIWGSTYLAVRFAVETLPPFTMMGVRSLVAGLALFAWSARRGGGRPSRREWRNAFVIGAFLFLVGHGGLAWAQQRVPSGIASLIIATIPIWMTLIQARTEGTGSVGLRTIAGLAGGSVGVLLLAGPGGFLGGDSVDPAGTVVLLVAALSWSAGSALAQKEPSARPLSATTGMYLIAGGILLLALSLLTGEPAVLTTGSISLRSVFSLTYLIVFGSVIAFAAYGWLLRHASLSSVSTYAWVNPVVALFVGWTWAGESLNGRVVAAALLVLTSVVLTLSKKGTDDDRENLARKNAQRGWRRLRTIRPSYWRRGAPAHPGQPRIDGAHCTG